MRVLCRVCVNVFRIEHSTGWTFSLVQRYIGLLIDSSPGTTTTTTTATAAASPPTAPALLPPLPRHNVVGQRPYSHRALLYSESI